MPEIEEPELLTRTQAARLLDRSPERVHQLSHSGRLPFVQTPLGRLYRVQDVEDLAKVLARGTRGEPPEAA